LQAKGVKMKPRREVGLTVMAIVDLILGLWILFLVISSQSASDKILGLIVGLPIAIMGFFTLDEHPSPGVKIANSVLALLLLLAALADTLQHGSNVLLWGLQVFYSLWVLGYFSVSLIKKSFK
jgi:hypothetical protein